MNIKTLLEKVWAASVAAPESTEQPVGTVRRSDRRTMHPSIYQLRGSMATLRSCSLCTYLFDRRGKFTPQRLIFEPLTAVFRGTYKWMPLITPVPIHVNQGVTL